MCLGVRGGLAEELAGTEEGRGGEGAGQRAGSVPDNQPQVLLGKLAAPAAVTKQ